MKKYLSLAIITVATLFNITFTTDEAMASTTDLENVYMYEDEDLPSEH